METKQNNLSKYLMFAFLLMFLVSGVIMLFRQVKKSQPTTGETGQIEREKENTNSTIDTRGRIGLVEAGQKDKELTVEVIANSDGEDISAYDIQIGFDQSEFQYVSATSLDKSFEVYPFAKDGLLTLTVVKSTTDSSPSVLSDERVLRLEFKTIKSGGEYSISVLPAVGNSTTKFVNINTEVITPEVGSLEVKVK